MMGQPPAGSLSDSMDLSGGSNLRETQSPFEIPVERVRKYRNEPQVIDGHTFASRAEAGRYIELKMMNREGSIVQLKLQPKFPITVEGKKICTYIADFSYLDAWSGKLTVEDVKGMKTPVYRLKKKLVEALYGIEIKETP